MRKLLLHVWFKYFFAVLLMLAGLALLGWVDWRLALGLFLFQWGVNMERRVQPWLESLSLAERLKMSRRSTNG